MAIANSIPGVPGGTIAFLFGFYDEFINPPNDLIGKNSVRRKQAFIFLFRLGIGWILSFCLSVLILSGLFQGYIHEISSVFMGSTLFAIPMVIREERHSIEGRYDDLIFTFTGMALIFCISYSNPAGRQGINVSMEHPSLGLVVYTPVTAMAAITAMVLPRVSGSTLLLVFGIYAPIIGTVKELLHMNPNYVPILAVFGLGIITGIVGIIKLTKLCLERYRSQATYTIIGLMIDSLYAITMGPITSDMPRDSMGLDTFRILFFPLGGLILAELGFMRTGLEKQ